MKEPRDVRASKRREEIQLKINELYELERPKEQDYNLVLSFPGHDACVVVSKGEKVLEVIELERLLNIKNVDWTRKVQIDYPSNTYQLSSPSAARFFIRQVSLYVNKKYPVKFKTCFLLDNYVKIIREEEINLLEFFRFEKVKVLHHHTCHAYGAFYQSNFEKALVITYDGGSPDNSCFNIYSLERNKTGIIQKFSALSIVKSYANLGLLFDEIKYELEKCNFSYPGKIMALSSYGKVNHKNVPLYKKFLMQGYMSDDELNSCQVLNINNFPKEYHTQFKTVMECSVGALQEFLRIHMHYMVEILKAEGIPNCYELACISDKLWTRGHFLETDMQAKMNFVNSVSRIKGQKAYDMAATIQYALEELFFDVTLPIINQFDKEWPIVLSGGGALNIILNTKIKEKTGRQVFVGPDPSDCGLGLGAMLSYLRPSKPFDNPYTGLEILDFNSLSMYVSEYVGIAETSKYKIIDEIHLKLDKLATFITEGKIFGVIRGWSERGPRALGNRSILCSATIPDMKDKLNFKVKFREWYRPFAPIVRLEDVSKYFEWEGESRYMNFCIKVREEHRDTLSQVTHVDGTARTQTITRKQNDFIYELLSELERQTGVGVLINTSFNVNNRPIINSVKDAFYMLENTELDGIIVENTLILKKR